MKIFITGVSSGLGLCLAKEFLRNGDEVWGIGRRNLDTEGLSEGFQGTLRYCQCDTTKIDQIKFTFEKMVKADYIPDIIIFCAGSATNDIIENFFRLDEFKNNFSVNLFGTLHWIELFLPYFIQRGKGSFATISSMSVYRENHRERIGYSASRIAINKAFENLFLEYSESGIKFIVFNMGRMQKKSGFIGTSYHKAASKICKILKSSKHSTSINIPFFQYVLTKGAQFIPVKIYKKYLMK
ncbi:MAG: hypothetical protein HKUEN01_33860 [Candidatus Kuenenia stuttgartiensis]|uniref:SDR family NAD(P)-dependent oxidoreductase n=1 Tax=Kuenenia stuttgartiensis TaxID=174633 RepID=UPI00146B3B00|nr:SDR family NAD(P)-dependent oxidoreductase [Candidatus Kuenenia stuttgartiensis]GJQ51000.1 MAG: hypothetical protein HKUEN01_33860 [Candidatus Kuenenia stuttgartiensis]